MVKNSERLIAFDANGVFVSKGNEDEQALAASGRLLVTLMTLPAEKAGQTAAEWIAFTPEGYYSASSSAARYIRWRVGDKLLPAEAYAKEFNRPDLVMKALHRQ